MVACRNKNWTPWLIWGYQFFRTQRRRPAEKCHSWRDSLSLLRRCRYCRSQLFWHRHGMEAVDTLWCLMCLKMPSFETQEYSGNSKYLNCPWILGCIHVIQVFESLKLKQLLPAFWCGTIGTRWYHHSLLHKSMRQQREARRLDLQCDPLQECPHCWGGGTGFTKIWSYSTSTYPTWVQDRIDISFHCTVMSQNTQRTHPIMYCLEVRGLYEVQLAEWKIWIHHLWPPVEQAINQRSSARSQPFHFCESLQAHAQGGQEVGCHCYDACPTGANLIVALCWSGKLRMIMFIHVYTV